MVKNLPAMWETWVRALGWEDPLMEEKAIHSWHGESGLENPRQRGACQATVHGVAKSQT